MTFLNFILFITSLNLFQASGQDFEYYVDGFTRNADVNPDSALYYANQMLDIAHNQEDDMGIIRAEYALGYVYRNQDNYVAAVQHYLNSLRLSQQQEYKERALMASNGLGMALFGAGDYPEALRYMYLSLGQRLERNIPEELSTVYNNIGLIFMKQYNWAKAHEFFTKALLQSDSQTNVDAPILVNLGLCLPQMDRFAEAMVHFDRFRQLCDPESLCAPQLWCEFYNAVGGSYLNQTQFATSEIYFEKALAIAREKGLESQLEKAYDNLSTIALEVGDYQRAKNYTDSALHKSLDLGLPLRIQSNYRKMARIHRKSGSLVASLEYWHKYDSSHAIHAEQDVLNEIYTLAMDQEEQWYDDHMLLKQKELSSTQRNVNVLVFLLSVIAIVAFMWWFNYKKKKKAMKELEDMQLIFVERQKMAALGDLMAGIAHEINSPLATVSSSVDASMENLNGLTDQQDNGTNDYENFRLLRDRYQGSNDFLVGRERRKKRRELESALRDNQIENVDKWSELLLESGIDTIDPPLVALLRSSASGYWMNKLHQILVLHRNNLQAQYAIDRIQTVIQSLKTHAMEPDRYLAETFDLKDNLKGVLVLLQNQLKYEVTLEVVFPEAPMTMTGNAQRLGQVWTNLMINALQAMEHVPKMLRLEAAVLGAGFYRIIITDNGHGIAIKHQGDVFANAFSTRHNAAGLGMGLFLCKQIVEEHDGRITFVSGAGFTEMNVFLPVQHYHGEL